MSILGGPLVNSEIMMEGLVLDIVLSLEIYTSDFLNHGWNS